MSSVSGVDRCVCCASTGEVLSDNIAVSTSLQGGGVPTLFRIYSVGLCVCLSGLSLCICLNKSQTNWQLCPNCRITLVIHVVAARRFLQRLFITVQCTDTVRRAFRVTTMYWLSQSWLAPLLQRICNVLLSGATPSRTPQQLIALTNPAPWSRDLGVKQFTSLWLPFLLPPPMPGQPHCGKITW